MSKQISSNSSSNSSRAQSPIVGSRQVSPRVLSPIPLKVKIQKEIKNFIHSKNFYLLLILPAILFLTFVANSKPYYCANGLNHFCITPKNGKIEGIKTLKCDENSTKIGKYCVRVAKENISKIYKEEKRLKNYIKEMKKKNEATFEKNEFTNATIEYLMDKGEIEINGDKITYTPLRSFNCYLYLSLLLSLLVIVSAKFIGNKL